MLKRAYMGTFYKLPPKHLQRYVSEFAGRHNLRNADTVAQVRTVVVQFMGLHAPLPAARRPQRASLRGAEERDLRGGTGHAPVTPVWHRPGRPRGPASYGMFLHV